MVNETNFAIYNWTDHGSESTPLSYFNITSEGNVGIGTKNPTSKLTVNGKILATEVQVVSSIASDYVFEPGYKLMPIPELEDYLAKNKHLPEVPSVKEFKEQGQNLGQMDDLLLRKIEELTLYIIEIKKSQEALETENRILKQQMNRLGISE